MYKYQSAFIANYNKASYKSVYEAYSKPSQAKYNIEHNIISDMLALGGYDYRVTSHNTFSFCAGFRFVDKVTGKEHLMYYTPSRTLDIPMEN